MNAYSCDIARGIADPHFKKLLPSSAPTFYYYSSSSSYTVCDLRFFVVHIFNMHNISLFQIWRTNFKFGGGSLIRVEGKAS